MKLVEFGDSLLSNNLIKKQIKSRTIWKMQKWNLFSPLGKNEEEARTIKNERTRKYSVCCC